MDRMLDRRTFLAGSAGLAGVALAGASGSSAGVGAAEAAATAKAVDPLFRISLAQWSFNRSHFGRAIEQRWEKIATTLRTEPRAMLQGDLDPLDFPKTARSLGIDGVEYVNTFFFDRARDQAYIGDLRRRCDGEGVTSVLIMCDNEGNLDDPDAAARTRAIENHKKWLEAAAFLGCHAIRVNTASTGSFEELQATAADGLRWLAELADPLGLNVLVENHGGWSSNGAWLAGVMKRAAHPRVGTLPDFGNFRLRDGEWYDRYQGVTEMMPWAKGVSAKSYEFDKDGNDTATDFKRMMKIVVDAGYHNWVGIEFEGRGSELDGVRATLALLKRVRDELAA